MSSKFFLTLSIVLIMNFAFSQEPNDCMFAIVVCGNGDLNLNATGAGTQELVNVACDGLETNSIWLKVSISDPGTLGFTLTPSSNSLSEDFDFWVFGPSENSMKPIQNPSPVHVHDLQL